MQTPTRSTAARTRSVVLLVGTSAVWPEELTKLMGPDEWDFILLKDLEDVPSQLKSRSVHGVIMTPRSWSARELVVLRECRSDSPQTALVVMAEDPVGPALKRALENGATAFLRWPASPEVILQALHSARHARPQENS
jgi:DNA-binding NarL/FixJ family response regulator